MKRGSRPLDVGCTGRQRNNLIIVAIICLVFMAIFIPLFLEMNSLPDVNSHVERSEDGIKFALHRRRYQEQNSRVSYNGNGQPDLPSIGDEDLLKSPSKASQDSEKRVSSYSKRNTEETGSKEERRSPGNTTGDIVSLEDVIDRAWSAGTKAWEELEIALKQGEHSLKDNNANATADQCPASLFTTGIELDKLGRVFPLPCGLMFGSAITLIGKPRESHMEYKPPIARVGQGVSPYVMVSQFIVELQGLKVVKGEDPPRILHINPRLHGDWSWKPIIEHNTCYRNQWGPAHRCEGWQVPEYEETVDGLPKCEKWLRDRDKKPASTQKSWWLGRLVGHSDKETLEWEYPLSEGGEFVLTIRAGVEGFHLTIDGRHISSFPYRAGYAVEEATGILVAGDVDVLSMTVTSLPLTHPSYYPELVLESGNIWKAPTFPAGKIELFVGIMSSSNHFAERMAVRKTWFQSSVIQSSQAVARFFVALHANKDINLQLKKEADYYGDIIILPFIDRYDIVVLKTFEIFKFGVQNVRAKFAMKCDDDTFVRIDNVLEEVRATSVGQGLYMGNMNAFHRPLRSGKWAVTVEEWPEHIYPTYANGPGYILSEDIAHFIVEESKNNNLRLFKMEDVSVGLWVREYAKLKYVQYEHSVRFAQAGCIPNYLTAHYQSPRQMLCLWDKVLATNDGMCCNL